MYQVTTPAHACTRDQSLSLRDPYPFFAHKRSKSGVFAGTVMDYSQDARVPAAQVRVLRDVVRRGQHGVP